MLISDVLVHKCSNSVPSGGPSSPPPLRHMSATLSRDTAAPVLLLLLTQAPSKSALRSPSRQNPVMSRQSGRRYTARYMSRPLVHFFGNGLETRNEVQSTSMRQLFSDRGMGWVLKAAGLAQCDESPKGSTSRASRVAMTPRMKKRDR